MTVLVPVGYSVPVFDGVAELPEDFLAHPYAIVARPHGDRQLEWSGINWTVKRTVQNIAVSPGPNLFNSDENNVFIDNNGWLHVKITNPTGQWLCSELIADTSLGYGTYTFNLKSRVDNMDVNTVLGIFTWDDIAQYSASMQENYYREYDFEFSYWSIPGNDVGQFVIQPWDNPGNIYRFPVGSEINTVHQLTWKKDTIGFISMRADSSVISQFEYTGGDYKNPGLENIRINLWLNFGQAPQGNQEAVLAGFQFLNLLEEPVSVSATDGSPKKVTVTWDDQPGKYFGIYRGISNDPLFATLLTEEWIIQSIYLDSLADIGETYYYWVRSSDNIQGSNSMGYASGYSDYDSGWAADTNMSVPILNRNDRIKISPNPCDVYTRIWMADNFDACIRIFDSRGSLCLERTMAAGELLNTMDLPSGVYYLQFTAEHGTICTAKLAVIH
jgi:hypothetical protein